jgi:hypothetical protein
MNVGVMKDYKLKLRNEYTSHSLGWSRNLSECEMEKNASSRLRPNGNSEGTHRQK